MATLDPASRAQFRILVAMARADGRLDQREEAALREVLGVHSDQLTAWLAEDIDVDRELAALDPKQRRSLYHSAFALAYADGDSSMHEVNLLHRILPDRGERSLVGQVFGEAADTLLPGNIVPVADPTRRDLEIAEDILKYSVLSAVAGAMPLPGVGIVADLAVIALQTKMVHDIGQYWGHTLDQHAIRGFMASVMGSAGLRIAVNNLARFVPGWGSAFGAATSFASTYALGRVAQRYFEAGRGLDEGELRSLFESAKTEAAGRYSAESGRIDATRAAAGAKLGELNDALSAGRISRADYDREVARLPR